LNHRVHGTDDARLNGWNVALRLCGDIEPIVQNVAFADDLKRLHLIREPDQLAKRDIGGREPASGLKTQREATCAGVRLDRCNLEGSHGGVGRERLPDDGGRNCGAQ
jgi:hypothetical protein